MVPRHPPQKNYRARIWLPDLWQHPWQHSSSNPMNETFGNMEIGMGGGPAQGLPKFSQLPSSTGAVFGSAGYSTTGTNAVAAAMNQQQQ